MKDKLKKFWEPMTVEMNKGHIIVNFIGSLGAFPAVMLARKVATIWVMFGIIILWWLLVVLIYLTYCYLKNKE